MYYLKEFNSHSDYERYMSGEPLLPNVSLCNNQNEVHYNPVDPYNGHEYVDLGLPSGLKWATMNVGANTETDYGLYFAWGETTGYADASSGKTFTWNDYEWGTENNLTKYNETDDKRNLDIEDDAAHVNMGGSWRMPSPDDLIELYDSNNTTHQWVTDYNDSGINGMLFTSLSNGNTLFVPACGGFSIDTEGDLSGSVFVMWTKQVVNISGFRSADAWIGTSVETPFTNQQKRCDGYCVRGVAE